MIRTTLAAALVATAVTAATTAAQAVPIADFSGLSITLETTPVNSSIATDGVIGVPRTSGVVAAPSRMMERGP